MAGDVPVWPDNMALMAAKGGCLQYTPKIEEYRKLRQQHYKHYEDFVKQLKVLEPPLDKHFVEIMDEQLDTLPLEMSEMFIDGFRLGARMMIEIYQKDFTDTCE